MLPPVWLSLDNTMEVNTGSVMWLNTEKFEFDLQKSP